MFKEGHNEGVSHSEARSRNVKNISLHNIFQNVAQLSSLHAVNMARKGLGHRSVTILVQI